MIARIAMAGLLLSAPRQLHAAGGAHVVDDSAVETPGQCHVESWIGLDRRGGGLGNISPACTRETWPSLELGGFVAHGWSDGDRVTAAGPSLKYTLRSDETGFGVALSATGGFDLGRGRLDDVALVVPVTRPVGKTLRLNLDLGCTWSRVEHGAFFAGAQAELAMTPALGAMVETFTRGYGKVGAQAGLRRTVDKGRIDLDLLAARYLDGRTPTTLTLGLTVRR